MGTDALPPERSAGVPQRASPLSRRPSPVLGPREPLGSGGQRAYSGLQGPHGSLGLPTARPGCCGHRLLPSVAVKAGARRWGGGCRSVHSTSQSRPRLPSGGTRSRLNPLLAPSPGPPRPRPSSHSPSRPHGPLSVPGKCRAHAQGPPWNALAHISARWGPSHTQRKVTSQSAAPSPHMGKFST